MSNAEVSIRKVRQKTLRNSFPVWKKIAFQSNSNDRSHGEKDVGPGWKRGDKIKGF